MERQPAAQYVETSGPPPVLPPASGDLLPAARRRALRWLTRFAPLLEETRGPTPAGATGAADSIAGLRRTGMEVCDQLATAMRAGPAPSDDVRVLVTLREALSELERREEELRRRAESAPASPPVDLDALRARLAEVAARREIGAWPPPAAEPAVPRDTAPARSGRLRIEEDGDRLVVEICARRNWPALLFVAFWLCGWTVGGLFTIGILIASFTPALSGPWTAKIFLQLFLLAWLGGWALGEAAAWSTLLWGLAGKETLILDRDSLIHRRSVGRWERSTVYARELLSAPRHAPSAGEGTAPAAGGQPADVAVFCDYGERTVSLCGELEEAEARRIAGALRAALDRPTAGDSAVSLAA